MKNREKLIGYLFALTTVTAWASTFISSKIVLEYYTPVQLMLLRFVLAYGVLWLVKPNTVKLPLRNELGFMLFGLTGYTLYGFLENTALTYTLASNVSIIVAAAPLFTVFLAHFTGLERLQHRTLAGFIIAFTGVILVVCNGTLVLQIKPKGDLLSLCAAACWATYSVLQRKINRDMDPIFMIRRALFWGIITISPLVILNGHAFRLEPLLNPVVLGNLLFLSLVGSCLCYILWNKAFRLLGVVTTNSFIYLQPFLTIVMAWLLLDEPLSPLAFLGAILITLGVVAAQRK